MIYKEAGSGAFKFSAVKWYNADGVDAPDDEIPELNEEWFETAAQYEYGKLVKSQQGGDQ